MACIVGVGRTQFSRHSGRTTLAMAAEAVWASLDDAGLPSSAVDGMATFQYADSNRCVEVAGAAGIDELQWTCDLYGGGDQACAVVGHAARAIDAGHASVVVVYRSLNGRSGHRFGQSDDAPVGWEQQFEAPVGCLVPAHLMAFWAARHQELLGSTDADLGAIAVTTREHAIANPHATMTAALSIDDYLASRRIVDPLRLLDCAVEVDGAVALVLVADDPGSRQQQPVRVAAHVESHAMAGSWTQWPDITSMYTARLARRLWAQAGCGPEGIDLACVYDCFTIATMLALEDLGFCQRGEVGRFYRSGRATYGGDVVVNPHGGLLSEGYLHGMNHFYEAVIQLRHAAGSRQVDDARRALVTAGSGPHGGAMVLVRS